MIIFFAKLVLLKPLSCPFFVAVAISAVSGTYSLLRSDCAGLLTGLVDLEEMVDVDVVVDGADNSFWESSVPARHL